MLDIKNVFARPNGLRGQAETAISCRGHRPTRKKKRYTRSRQEEDADAHMCPWATTIESRTHT